MPGVALRVLTKRYGDSASFEGLSRWTSSLVPGASVTLAIAPEACVPLTAGGDGGPTAGHRIE